MDSMQGWTPFRDRLRGRDGLGAGTDLPQMKRNAMYVRVFFFFCQKDLRLPKDLHQTTTENGGD